MEFTARTVTHPDGSLAQAEAERQLISHPEFKKGTVIIAMNKTASGWMATIHEPKLAGDPPPFAADDETGGAPSDESKPADDAPEPEGDEGESDGPKDEKKDEPKSEKAELGDVLDLVKQIAQAVGIPTGDVDPLAGPEAELGGPPHPSGPEGLGPDGPPGGPEGGPPHDETSPFPGAGDSNTKQIIHRKAPPGATPIGAPAFASTKQAKVASFELSEEVPEDFTLEAAKQEIESIYGPHGYKVKKMVSAHEGGKRFIRAKVSVR